MRTYDLSKLKVLIVEKHAPMRVMLFQVLREFGIDKIIDTPSIEDGFEAFIESKPDLVMIDWAPDFDGLSLVRRIRSENQDDTSQPTVIMVTAFNETNHIYEALDAGMTEYLTKPISARLLYMRIVSVIENKRRFIRADGFVGPDRRRRQGVFGGPDRRHEEAA
ncbi:MAG: response regulator [Rhodospirillales bacterium]